MESWVAESDFQNPQTLPQWKEPEAEKDARPAVLDQADMLLQNPNSFMETSEFDAQVDEEDTDHEDEQKTKSAEDDDSSTEEDDDDDEVLTQLPLSAEEKTLSELTEKRDRKKRGQCLYGKCQRKKPEVELYKTRIHAANTSVFMCLTCAKDALTAYRTVIPEDGGVRQRRPTQALLNSLSQRG